MRKKLIHLLGGYTEQEMRESNCDSAQTGSCRFGRDEFAANHGLDHEDGAMTMRQFINLTINAYGGDAIKELLHAYTTTTRLTSCLSSRRVSQSSTR